LVLRLLALTSCYPDSERTGRGHFVERQLRALAARPDVEVEVVVPAILPVFPLSLRARHRLDRALPPEETRHGLRVHRPRLTVLPDFIGGSPPSSALALRPTLAAIRRRFPFDLIHAEFFWPDGAMAMRLARALGVPYTIKARGADFEHHAARRPTRPRLLEAGREAAGLLAVSAATREAMIALGLPGDRIAVHRTGIDTARFRPRDRVAAKAALRLDGPVLLNVGNLIARKRQSLAIEALRHIGGATLLLVGGGPERRALERRAAALGVERRVRFMGSIPHALMPSLFAAADVTVHTSRMEGLANIWVESLACGTPVVTTEAGGAREAIDRPEAGRVVADDAEAIAAAVRELLAEPPAPERVAAAAGRFSWERSAAELETLLRDALSRASTRPLSLSGRRRSAA
jgi:glycosyltransferase involved in cell wall biosynthesis